MSSVVRRRPALMGGYGCETAASAVSLPATIAMVSRTRSIVDW